MNMTFDEAVAAMVRDCALVSDKGNIVDLTKPRVRRKAASVISYRRLYAPLVRTLGQNARGVDVCVHVVDTWLHHPDRKTVYPGELEYPLHENEWWWVEAASKHPSIYRIPDHLRNNPNYKPSLKVVK